MDDIPSKPQRPIATEFGVFGQSRAGTPADRNVIERYRTARRQVQLAVF